MEIKPSATLVAQILQFKLICCFVSIFIVQIKVFKVFIPILVKLSSEFANVSISRIDSQGSGIPLIKVALSINRLL